MMRLEGSGVQRDQFITEVLFQNLCALWFLGCAAPTVKGYEINMPTKPGGKPVAMQPIPLSPYDQLRIQYHMWESIYLGKLRKVNVVE